MARGEVRYRITADSKPFVDAAGAAQKELKKLTADALASAGSFGRVAAAAGPAGAVIAAGMAAAAAAVALVGKAVYDMSARLVETGGKLADLSAKTALSSESLQKLGYAGSLVGVSLEAVSGAAVKMELNIAKGNDAFGKLGLSVTKLRAMRPDEAFATIAAQLGKVKDQAGLVAAGTAIFGKSFSEILPLIKSDMAAATAEAEKLGIVLTDKTVKAADALGDEATKLSAAWQAVQNQFAAVIVENPALLNGLHALVETMGELARWLIENRGGLALLTDTVASFATSAITGFRAVSSWAMAAGRSLRFVADAVPDMRSAMSVMRDLQFMLGVANQGGGLSSSSRAMTELSAGGINFSAGVEKLTKAQKDAAAAAEEHRKKLEELIFGAMGGNATAQLTDYAQAMAEMGGVASMNTVMFERWHTAIRALIADGGRLPESLRNAGFGIDPRLPSLSVRENAFGPGWRAQTRDQAGAAEKTSVKIERAVQRVQRAWELAAAAVAIYNNGVQGASKGRGAMQGAMAGAAAGSAFGPWGTVIGAVGGGILGYLGGKEGEKRQWQAIRAELVALQAEAKLAGIGLMEAFDPDSAEGMIRAIEEIRRGLDLQAEAHQKLNEAMERYGITVEQLGPTFRQQGLDEMAIQLIQDFRLLEAAGVDVALILERMGVDFSKYIQAVIRSGATVPESMRGIIQSLIDQRLLLDENGRAFESVEEAGITFAESMSTQFQTLITKITDLVNALLGIPNIMRTVTINTQNTGGGGSGGAGTGSGSTTTGYNYDGTIDYDNDPSTPFAAGGYIPATPGGRLIRVAEGGEGEWVVNGRQMAALKGGGGPETLVIQNYLYPGGSHLDDTILRRVHGGYVKVS